MSILEALKAFGEKLNGTRPEGDTLAEAILSMAEQYHPPQSSENEAET